MRSHADMRLQQVAFALRYAAPFLIAWIAETRLLAAQTPATCSQYFLDQFATQRAKVSIALARTPELIPPEPFEFAAAESDPAIASVGNGGLTGGRAQACEIAASAIMPAAKAQYLTYQRLLRAPTTDLSAGAFRFPSAVVSNQLGMYRDVAEDEGLRNSTDALARYEHARAAFLAGNSDSALVELRRLLDGADAAACLLFLQHMFLALDRGTKRDVYRGDLCVVARGALQQAEVVAALAGLSLAGRLRTHYERLLHADQWYFGRGRPTVILDSAIAGERPLFVSASDARREVYVRLGRPEREVHTMYVADYSEAVTWLYPDPESKRPILYHFAGSQSPYSMTNAGGSCKWYDDRATLVPQFGSVHLACVSRDSRLRRDRMRAAASAAKAAYARNAEKVIIAPTRLSRPFAYALYTFRSTDERSSDVAVVAGAAAQDTGGLGELGAFLVSADGHVRSASIVDSARGKRRPASFVSYALGLSGIDAGEYRYRVRMGDAALSEGMVYGGDLVVRGFSPGRLSISDLVIVRDTLAGVLRRGDFLLSPYLGPVTSPRFAVYCEVYGLPVGSTFSVSLHILGPRRLLRHREELRLTFDEQMRADGISRLLKSVEHGLAPGRYTVRIEVQSPESKQVASSEGILEIR